MKNKIEILTFFIGAFFFFTCSENKKKIPVENEQTTKWTFSKEIKLDNVSPIGIVAQGDFLWLSDVDNNRLVKIDLNGKIVDEYGGFQRPMHIAINNSKIYIPEYISDTVKIIESGSVSVYSLIEKPDGIGGVAVDGNTVAITDFYNHRIILQKKDSTIIIGKEGHNDGELYYPTDVEIKNNLIYVADAYNNRVQVFDFNGNYVRMIGWNESIKVATGLKVTDTEVIVADFDGNRVLVYDIYGKLLQALSGKFNKPTDIEVYENIMYVVNYKGQTVSIFTNKKIPLNLK
jgi:DNA-binding beta-propeller fold protein YncE